MMNALASQCSSGCESGWTLYLEHSFQLQHHNNPSSHTSSEFVDKGFCVSKKTEKEEAEEEDLSMVSDASSGPPHLPDAQDNERFYSPSKAAKLGNKRSKKRQKVKENQHLPSFLDDTASSPVFDFSMNNVTATNQQTSTESMLDYSQGFSATYYEERSSLQDPFGFLQPSLSENGVHKNKERDGNDIKAIVAVADAQLGFSRVPIFKFKGPEVLASEMHDLGSPKGYGKTFSAFPTTAKPNPSIPIYTEEIRGGFIAFKHVVRVLIFHFSDHCQFSFDVPIFQDNILHNK
ncbi:hypothetical protein VNO78_07456 [Psophocarpus tetragonolobus]|uniref:Uncharacterized protein n=1 Tax=Psophocarpus tetragonolobus TaxID=3891 RepID=A0AAN9XSS2_PSOTE